MEPFKDDEVGSQTQEGDEMKKGRILSLRGEVVQNELKTIFDYEGTDLTRGWKVLSAKVIELSSPARECLGIVLHTNEAFQLPIMSQNQVIGFAARGSGGAPVLLLDPNHVIVSSLYLSGLSAIASYIIVLEEVKMDSSRNVIYQLKERAQGALN